MAGMPKYDANAERAADAYHRVPLPVKERDNAGSDLAGRTRYSDSHGKPPLTRYIAVPFRFGTPPRRPDLRVWRVGTGAGRRWPGSGDHLRRSPAGGPLPDTVDGWVAQTGYQSGLGGNNLEAAHGPTAKLLAARPAPRHSRDLVVLRRKVTQRSR